MNKSKCVVCDSEDFDFQTLQLPIRGELRPVAVVFCCDKCKDALQSEIRGYGDVISKALDAWDKAESELIDYYARE